MKKWVSYLIDGVLGTFVAGLVLAQVMMNISRTQNYNVPFLFGQAFLRVETNSMEGDNPDSLPTGTGIIVKKVDAESLKPGDVVTYYSKVLSAPVTHRVMEIETKDGVLNFYTRGDNYLHADTCQIMGGCSESTRDPVWTPEYLIGKVDSHSDALGAVLGVTSQAWFVPVAVLVPLAIIGTLTAVDLIKQARAEDKAEKAAIAAAMAEAGVDPNDEVAVTIFTEKQKYMYELQKEIDRQKAEEKKKIEKALKGSKRQREKVLQEANYRQELRDAGIDPDDEKAVYMYEEKQKYIAELKQQLEKGEPDGR